MAAIRLSAARNAHTLLRSSRFAPVLAPRSFAFTLRTFAAAAASPTMTGKDLLNEIKVDHDNIRDLLKRFHDAHKHGDKDHCEAIVNTIIHEAAVHSDAEELSVYKLMEKFGMNTVADKDRDDHQHVKQAMSELDTHSISGAGLDVFAQRVDKACKLFIEHAEEEENDQLPRLCKLLSAEDHSKAVDDFLHARKLAPTRPHPSAPQTGGMMQKAAGATAKPLDKAVEMGRKFVDLKHHHSDEAKATAACSAACSCRMGSHNLVFG